MEHWTTAFLGRPYVAGRYDCADLVADALEERFGVRVRLPGRAASVRGLDAQIGAAFDRDFAATAHPVDGDVVLMRVFGRRYGVGHHLGVWCDVGGVPHVLHLPAGGGVCLHAIDDLPRRGWEVTGVYARPRGPLAR